MLDMQVVLGMSTDREIIVRDLYYQGINVDDGLLCHIFKVILWLGRVYNFQEYNCYRLNNTFRAGRQVHTIEQWKKFTDREILEMDGRKALKFYHDVLLKIIDL